LNRIKWKTFNVLSESSTWMNNKMYYIWNKMFTFLKLFCCKIFSLWAVSETKYGGLSFEYKEVGQALAVAGIIMTLTTSFSTSICDFLIK
jgi:hypothetical protein